MRIAYVAKIPVHFHSGVLRKIALQVKAWEDAGHVVSLHVLTQSPEIPDCAPPGAFVYRFSNLTSRFRMTRALVDRVLAMSCDVVYLRYFSYQPGLDRLMRARNVVFEINTDDVAEQHLMSRRSAACNRLTRRRFLRKGAGAVFVTDELAKAAAFCDAPTPRAVIANGIDLEAHPSRLRAPVNEQPRLVFVGSPDLPWHGVEDLISFARRRPEWTFELVGPSAPASSPPRNVAFLGFLEPQDYLQVLDRSDVAISTLGLYRKNMTEACPLKAREYLARGLPVISGYHDTDFPHGAAFLCELPAGPDSLVRNVATVDKFVDAMRGYQVAHADVAQIDSRAKEDARLSYFESTVAGG